MSKNTYPIFTKSLVSLAGLAMLAGFLYTRAGKGRQEFDAVSGKIVQLETPTPDSDRNKKLRLLRLENDQNIFELFIGKDAGDFKPQFENIDALHTGDSVTVYYDGSIESPDAYNHLAYFIDKDQTPYFVKGSWEKGMALFLWGLAIVVLIAVLILKKKGKIA